MTFSYSGDPADSNLDEIRFYVQDTDSVDQLLSDEEIEFLYTRWNPIYGSNLMVASMAAEAIAAKFAREVSYSADGVSVGVQELQQKYDALASSLRDQYKLYDVGSDTDFSQIMYSNVRDHTIKPTIWGIGMNDNVRAGSQEFGGDMPAEWIEGSYEQGGDTGVPA